jgi:hypothetical protein
MPVIFHQQNTSLFTLSGDNSDYALVDIDATLYMNTFPTAGVLRQFAFFRQGHYF